MKNYTDETDLDYDILEYYGFELEKKRNEELQIDGLWYNGFYLHEDFYTGDFNFAVYVRGSGCLKSGYSANTVGRLKELYRGITGRDLKPNPKPIPNKL